MESMIPVNLVELADELVVNLEKQLEWATDYLADPDKHAASLTQYVVSLGDNTEALFTSVGDEFRFCGCVLDCNAYSKEQAEHIKTHALDVPMFAEVGVSVLHISVLAARIKEECPSTLENMRKVAADRKAETLLDEVNKITVSDTPNPVQGQDIEEAEIVPSKD